MLDFSKSWGQEIAEITSKAEFEPALVRVIDPDSGTTGYYDVDENEWVGGTDPEPLYEGRARFAPIRWGVEARDTHLFNSSTTTRIRFQFGDPSFPKDELPSGTLIEVVEAPTSPSMEGRVAVVTNDLVGSSQATRTVETEYNHDQPEIGGD